MKKRHANSWSQRKAVNNDHANSDLTYSSSSDIESTNVNAGMKAPAIKASLSLNKKQPGIHTADDEYACKAANGTVRNVELRKLLATSKMTAAS